MIVAAGDNPWGLRRKGDDLGEALVEARRKFDFDYAGPAYRAAYITAIQDSWGSQP